MARTYILGRFRLDAEAAILFREAVPVALGQRAVALLRVLVGRPGIPVSKGALIEAAWPGLTVEESNLTVQISALRRVFREEPNGEGWIETLPRRGYRFVGPVSVEDGDAAIGEPLPIAVLPFANSSGDPNQQYFADGLTEDIITDLSRVSALFVVSRNTVFALTEKHLPVREMARQLNVDYVLEGSVRTAEDRVRITAHLVDAGTGGQMWADRYDRRLEDIFALQDEISRSIVGALEVRLLPTEAATLARRPTTMTEAFQYYLKGRSHFLRGGRSRRTLRLAQQMFGKAIEVDSRYARAYAGLANCDSYLLCLGDPDVTFEQILAHSERALALEPNLAEAHAARGLALYMSGNHEEADIVLERAMQLGPSLFEAHYFAARNHQARGLYEQAAALFERASQIEPDDYSALGLAVATNRSLGREDDMRSVAKRCLERVEAEIAIHPDHAGALAFGASVQAELGDKTVAETWADRAAALDPDNAITNYNVACTYAALGKLDAALDHLRQVFAAPSPNWRFHFEWMKYDSSLDPVRSHPGYGALLKRLEPEIQIDPLGGAEHRTASGARQNET
jgi:adenylate cyclase